MTDSILTFILIRKHCFCPGWENSLLYSPVLTVYSQVCVPLEMFLDYPDVHIHGLGYLAALHTGLAPWL